MAKRKRRPAKELADLDIVIPVYGRPDLLQKCLNSIEATQGDIKTNLIIVDDQGPDQDKLKKLYQSLNGFSQVIRHVQNMGFPKTVNDGLNSGIAPLVLVLNTDVELHPGALRALIKEFHDQAVGIAGPKLLFPPDSGDPHRPANYVQHAGLAVDFGANITHVNIGWPADAPKVNERREVQAITGAAMMLRREMLPKIMKIYRQGGDITSGPFNEIYNPGTYEDVELCFVARSEKYKVIYTPDAVAFHHVGASVEARKGGYPIGRNEMIFKARCGHMLAWDEWRYL